MQTVEDFDLKGWWSKFRDTWVKPILGTVIKGVVGI